MTGFEVVRSRSDAGTFHARTVPDPASPALWWHQVTRPALVLGSNQDDAVVDRASCEREGVDVVRRRSGGGAVLLVPGEVAWLDAIVPRGSPGWSDDVHRPMVWFGEHLAAAFATAASAASTSSTSSTASAAEGATDGIDRLAVHRGPMVSTEWSGVVCFDGLGAGEITLDGAKLVGISQRRTRSAARLQCCWYTGYDPERLLRLLAVPSRPRPSDLGPVATVPHTTTVLAALGDALGTTPRGRGAARK